MPALFLIIAILVISAATILLRKFVQRVRAPNHFLVAAILIVIGLALAYQSGDLSYRDALIFVACGLSIPLFDRLVQS